VSDCALEQELARILFSRWLTIATAESCTGGLVAYRIVTVPGISEYFLGGVVAYSNAMKESFLGVQRSTLETHGAVSRETALEMARGIRQGTRAHIGISTTGIAGPTGGTPAKPVGLVYIACVTPDSEDCEEYCFGSGRMENIEQSVRAALALAIRQLSSDVALHAEARAGGRG
jgi:PncC family amidohydrolase